MSSTLAMALPPLDASQIVRFTPPALAGEEAPPTFRLRTPTRRDRSAYDYRLIAEGLTWHDIAAMRAETVRALKANWSESLVAEHLPRIEAFWEEADAWLAQQRDLPVDEREDRFDHPDAEAVAQLGAETMRSWPRLREMAADNSRFDREGPALMLSIVLTGWDGIDAVATREGGYLTIDSVHALADAMERRWPQDGKAMLALAQLHEQAVRLMYLDRGAEKNSASLPPSSPTPTDMATGSESTNGTSPASAPSRKTRASRSTGKVTS